MTSKDWRPTAFVETAPSATGDDDIDADPVPDEPRSALHASLRQLTTLAAAALLVSMALIGRVFAEPVGRGALGWAVAAFLLSLIGSGATGLVVLASSTPPERRLVVAATTASFALFAAGMAALTWFFCRNWLR